MAVNIKDKDTLKWLFKQSKAQIFKIITLIAGNGIFAASSIVFALMCQGIVDGAVDHSKDTVIKYGIGLFCVIMGQLILRLYCNSVSEYIHGRLGMNMRAEILDMILKKEYSNVSEFHSGELLNRMFSDVTIIVNGITNILPNLVNMVTRLLCAVIVLIALDKSFTMLFIISGLAMFFVTRLFRKKMKALHKDVQEKEGKVKSFLQETLENDGNE